MPMTTETDRGHDRAAAAVVAEDPARVADEAVDVLPDAWVLHLGDHGTAQFRPVLQQVVHDQGTQDDPAGQRDDRADAGQELGGDAFGERRGRFLALLPRPGAENDG